MRDTNPEESLEAEGIPTVEDQPPGIDVETEQEGMIAPRDYPIAAGADPAYPVTAAEERQQEGVVERARREEPDVGADELGVGGGVAGAERDGPDAGGTGGAGQLLEDPGVVGDDSPLTAEGAEDAELAASPEEAAVEVRSDDEL